MSIFHYLNISIFIIVCKANNLLCCAWPANEAGLAQFTGSFMLQAGKSGIASQGDVQDLDGELGVRGVW